MICDICNVDHATTWPDLSHGIIEIMQCHQTRVTWMEWPISGDAIAVARAHGEGSLLYLTDWDDEQMTTDMRESLAESSREDQHQRDGRRQ